MSDEAVEDSTIRLQRDITEATKRYQMATKTTVRTVRIEFHDIRTAGGNFDTAVLDRLDLDLRCS